MYAAFQCTRAHRERGSALLVVFVFAAIIAIALYAEIPVAVFEARRQQEQLLIDRGSEYKHAVKLFVRRLGTYPTSLDSLENTNTVRFLRKRYSDPFTKKADWRLLHAGPGGVLMDSHVNSLNPDATPPSPDSGSEGEVQVTPVRHPHGPAIRSGSAAAESNPSGTETLPDPTTSLLPAGEAERLTDNSPNVAPSDSSAGANGSDTSSPQPRPLGGQAFGGLIAGVASNAKGHSIRRFEKQTDYSLWEFYYDPTKDPLGPFMIGPTQNPVGVNGTGAPGTSNVPATGVTGTSDSNPVSQ